MGLPADGHLNFDKLTGTQQEVAMLLTKTKGSEILPFPPGLGQGPLLVVAAEAGIWPKSKILVVSESASHQSWHRYWLEFGSGANSFHYGVPDEPWGGPGKDDPPGGVCVVKPSDLIGEAGEAILARGWDLAVFACPDALSSTTARNKALKQAQRRLRSWVLLPGDQTNATVELSEVGHYLAGLDLAAYDQVPDVPRPGVLLRPSCLSSLAERLPAV